MLGRQMRAWLRPILGRAGSERVPILAGDPCGSQRERSEAERAARPRVRTEQEESERRDHQEHDGQPGIAGTSYGGAGRETANQPRRGADDRKRRSFTTRRSPCFHLWHGRSVDWSREWRATLRHCAERPCLFSLSVARSFYVPPCSGQRCVTPAILWALSCADHACG
jgi:hypothetical protein